MQFIKELILQLQNFSTMKKQYKFFLWFLMFAFIGSKALAQSTAPDSLTFDSGFYPFTIHIDSGSLWQIGEPQKSVFNHAHHGSKALLTDTLNTYPANDTSRFTMIIPSPYISTCASALTFSHKYDMDTQGDQGYIEASYDGGNSWLMLKDTMGNSDFNGPYFFTWNWDYQEDTVWTHPHNIIINGSSKGWITSGFYWQWWVPVKSDTIIINPDSLMLRFTFISDSINKNKDGWMIDDISVWAQTDCSGINENSADFAFDVFPNPARNNVNLSFAEPMPEINIEVINSKGQVVLSENFQNQSLLKLDLSKQTKGLYFIKVNNENRQVVRKVMVE